MLSATRTKSHFECWFVENVKRFVDIAFTWTTCKNLTCGWNVRGVPRFMVNSQNWQPQVILLSPKTSVQIRFILSQNLTDICNANLSLKKKSATFWSQIMMVDKSRVCLLGWKKIINQKFVKSISQSSPSWDFLLSNCDWRISGYQTGIKKKNFCTGWNLLPNNIDNINITDKVAHESKCNNRRSSIYIIILYVRITGKKMKRHGTKFSLYFARSIQGKTD